KMGPTFSLNNIKYFGENTERSMVERYHGDIGEHEGSKNVRCMLLDVAPPAKSLLFNPLAHVFAHPQISFTYDKDEDGFRLTVFDPSLRSQRLMEGINGSSLNALLRGQSH
ncbi:hypothetical protein GN958_ATG13027, partial [Phytophthora infestans]